MAISLEQSCLKFMSDVSTIVARKPVVWEKVIYRDVPRIDRRWRVDLQYTYGWHLEKALEKEQKARHLRRMPMQSGRSSITRYELQIG